MSLSHPLYPSTIGTVHQLQHRYICRTTNSMTDSVSVQSCRILYNLYFMSCFLVCVVFQRKWHQYERTIIVSECVCVYTTCFCIDILEDNVISIYVLMMSCLMLRKISSNLYEFVIRVCIWMTFKSGFYGYILHSLFWRAYIFFGKKMVQLLSTDQLITDIIEKMCACLEKINY